MTCKRGDVILVRFPNSDLITYRKRPALLVQADDLDTGLDQRIVALITTTPRTGETRVPIPKGSPEGSRMGLVADSVIVADNLVTVRGREIDRVIGACPDMARVDSALRRTLGL